jgi:ribosomal protein S18 acetylase RimI-like enzyme
MFRTCGAVFWRFAPDTRNPIRHPGQPLIRRATPSDHAGITGLAAEVYGDLGDYGSILPSWFVHPGVEVYVDTESDTVSDKASISRVRSFLLLGFFEPLSQTNKQLLVDLLAIAVVPDCQRQGVGRKLLREAIRLATEAADGFSQADIRLTVSESNPVAQRLFSSEGFEILDPYHGTYDRGQRAIRMNRRLLIS